MLGFPLPYSYRLRLLGFQLLGFYFIYIYICVCVYIHTYIFKLYNQFGQCRKQPLLPRVPPAWVSPKFEAVLGWKGLGFRDVGFRAEG